MHTEWMPAAAATGGHTRFVWPPRPVDPDSLDPPPPDETTSDSIAPPPSATDGGSSRPLAARDWLRRAENDWLGVCDVAWRDAVRLTGWRADAQEAYCPRCGTSTGPFESDADGCPACRKRRLAWSRSVRLGPYEGVLRDAILATKYTAWRRVGQELGCDLGAAVAGALREARIDPGSVIVCPVATSRRRRLARGVDHTLILAREVARQTGGRLVQGLRREHRPPQSGLSGSARQRNVAKSFHLRRPMARLAAGRTVVLVDDVRTTGATLSAAARALQRGVRELPASEPATIWTAVAAVTSRQGGSGA